MRFSPAHRWQHLSIFNTRLKIMYKQETGKMKRIIFALFAWVSSQFGSRLTSVKAYSWPVLPFSCESLTPKTLAWFHRWDIWSKQTFLSQAWWGASGPSKMVRSILCQCVQSAQHGVLWGPIKAHGHYSVNHVGHEYFQLAIPTQSQEIGGKLGDNIERIHCLFCVFIACICVNARQKRQVATAGLPDQERHPSKQLCVKLQADSGGQKRQRDSIF